MRIFEVWSEGYTMQGNTSCAMLMGVVVADNFKTACNKVLGEHKAFDKSRLTYWGCKLFDNEHDARQSFG
jgi:hypothetical protein